MRFRDGCQNRDVASGFIFISHTELVIMSCEIPLQNEDVDAISVRLTFKYRSDTSF
jgi:hypothetical protein